MRFRAARLRQRPLLIFPTVEGHFVLTIDQFHLTFRVPNGLRPAEARAVTRALRRKTFLVGLRRAVAAFLRRRPALRKVRVLLSP
jgi:hypothetical protein